jgi:hypothetical protein
MDAFNLFYILTIVNNTAINVGRQIPVQYTDFLFLGNIPNSGIAGS